MLFHFDDVAHGGLIEIRRCANLYTISLDYCTENGRVTTYALNLSTYVLNLSAYIYVFEKMFSMNFMYSFERLWP